MIVIDRKGRLHIFYNGPEVRHIRYDHRAINLSRRGRASRAVYRAGSVAACQLRRLERHDDAGVQRDVDVDHARRRHPPRRQRLAVHVVAGSGPDQVLLVQSARCESAAGYFIPAAEQPRRGPNHHYLGATLLESTSAAGPWTSRTLYRVPGNNAGVPYQNWVLISDLQADAGGRVGRSCTSRRASLDARGRRTGCYIAREEDAYGLRFVGGPVMDGYTLYVDPSGRHVAFGQIESVVPFPEFPGAPLGVRSDMVTFESSDGGASWTGPSWVELASINPVLVDQRNGSMLGGKEIAFIYSTEKHPAIDRLVFDEVRSSTVPLAVPTRRTGTITGTPTLTGLRTTSGRSAMPRRTVRTTTSTTLRPMTRIR